MTFDEAIKEYKLRSSVGPLVQGMNLSPFVNVPQQEYDRVKFLNNLFYATINKLRQEYAPAIYMKESEYDFIFPLIKKGKEMGATFTEFWSVYKDDRNREHLKPIFETQEKAMLIWLHPETIKVIGENNDTATSSRNED